MRPVDDSTPRPRFRTHLKATPVARDPEALLGELPRTPDRVGPLWSHQADHLRTYAGIHLTTPDVAFELPTGSGKTLVGLLIAEWKRSSKGHRVVYACPTRQLAHQVVSKARAEGIDARGLYGPSKYWSAADAAAYTMGQAIAVTTYSSIFNIKSRFADAQTILFDDAHAAENYVADAWAITIDAATAEYADLFDAFGELIEPALVRRMTRPDSSSIESNEVRLLPISAVAARVDEIDAVLATLRGDASYRFSMIRDNLASCLFYVSRQAFYIRPMIPPTFQHGPFVDAEQRIYLSATLGHAGELERSFGRRKIERVPVPPEWEKTGAGRRFFVFPDLATLDGMDGDATPDATSAVAKLMALGDKHVVLTPDEGSAQRIVDELDIPPAHQFDAKDASTGIDPFLKAPRGTLLAPNRYDGMDVKDDACRLLLVNGLPIGAHLQDRFLASKLRATHVLEERTNTRIVQGFGRCTRGPKDWAVVLVSGDDLLTFVSRAEFRSSLAPHLRAEIEFGLEQSQRPIGELVQLAESALHQDEIWREDAEPALVELRRSAQRQTPASSMNLAATASKEVRAWELAWQQNWNSAAEHATQISEELLAPELRAYRSLWLYLASAWFRLASRIPGDSHELRAVQLLDQAHGAAQGTTWLKEVVRLSEVDLELEPSDQSAVDRVVSLAQGRLKSNAAFQRRTAEMLDNLAAKDATKFEPGAAALGTFLGADSFKPKGQGRADAVWLWVDLWIAIEAKSNQQADGPISMDYIRQANTQLASLKADLEVDQVPPNSASVVVSPRRVVDPDGVPIAQPHVHVVEPRDIVDVAHDARRAWKSIRALAHDDENALRREVGRYLWENRVLPTQVRERLTTYQVNPGAPRNK